MRWKTTANKMVQFTKSSTTMHAYRKITAVLHYRPLIDGTPENHEGCMKQRKGIETR